MVSEDFEHAIKEFRRREAAFIIVKNREVVSESIEKGVAPFFFAVSSLNVKGASLADKIVGKAVAFLCVHAGIASVYAQVMSNPALEVLRTNAIYAEADAMVPMILNRKKDGQCPIEKIVDTCTTAEEAFAVLKRKFEGLHAM